MQYKTILINQIKNSFSDTDFENSDLVYIFYNIKKGTIKFKIRVKDETKTNDIEFSESDLTKKEKLVFRNLYISKILKYAKKNKFVKDKKEIDIVTIRIDFSNNEIELYISTNNYNNLIQLTNF